jgi:hypothetical protein
MASSRFCLETSATSTTSGYARWLRVRRMQLSVCVSVCVCFYSQKKLFRVSHIRPLASPLGWYILHWRAQVVATSSAAALAKEHKMKFFETSAKDMVNIVEAFEASAGEAHKRMLAVGGGGSGPNNRIDVNAGGGGGGSSCCGGSSKGSNS